MYVKKIEKEHYTDIQKDIDNSRLIFSANMVKSKISIEIPTLHKERFINLNTLPLTQMVGDLNYKWGLGLAKDKFGDNIAAYVSSLDRSIY